MFNHTQTYFQKILKDTVNKCEESGNYLVLQMLRQETVDAAPPARGFYCLQDESLRSYSLTAQEVKESFFWNISNQVCRLIKTKKG